MKAHYFKADLASLLSTYCDFDFPFNLLLGLQAFYHSLFNVPPNPPDGSDRCHVHARVYILVYETWPPQCVYE